MNFGFMKSKRMRKLGGIMENRMVVFTQVRAALYLMSDLRKVCQVVEE